MIARYSCSGAFGTTYRKVEPNWLLALFCAWTIVALTGITPWLNGGTRAMLHFAFGTLCHQEPGRSFEIGGVPFAVCHRCFGIYLGIALGVSVRAVGPRLRQIFETRARVIVGASATLLALDWCLGAARLWANTPASRFVTGLLAGATGGIYLALALTGGRDANRKENRWML